MKARAALLLLASSPLLLAQQGWQPGGERPELPVDSFVLPEGLEITVWASSPDLFNPTNIDFDHHGRAWVLEGVNYRGRAGRRPEGDRIVILEDSNGDGSADSSRVFWQDPELVSPLGIAVFDNVVLVSQPPHLLKLTDVNRDGRFDPADGDTREVLLTGFNGRNHDHSLHSVTATPDGRWMFNQGNCQADFTDASGRRFPIGSAYYQSGGGEWPFDTRAISGQASADGFVYVGGFTAVIDPDGSNARILGHGYRNSYEQSMTSFGHVFQNDNDDPPACRTSHVIEAGNAGYFSADGLRFWNADVRPGQDTPTAHWRQDDPGVMPAGDVYGGGSPTGVAFYENGALGEEFVGTLLSCEAARNVIFGYQPEPEGAGFALERTDFLTTNPERRFDGADFTGGVREQPREDNLHLMFRPSDVVVGPDGALYVTDWFDPRVGGHDTQNREATGAIYRITRKGDNPRTPRIDPATAEGAVAALRSPAVNVRWLGFETLRKGGERAWPSLAPVLEDPNPFVAARAIWLLPHLGEEARAKLDELLSSDDEMLRLTAFRAIRHSGGAMDPLPVARRFATDPSPALRAEAAIEMRQRPFEESREVLLAVAERFDGEDRSYLETLGLGAGHHTAELWDAIVETAGNPEPLEWSDGLARLAWRMMAPSAVELLARRAAAESLPIEQRRLALDSLAFIPTEESVQALISLSREGSDLRDQAIWWLQNRSEGMWSSILQRARLEEEGVIEKMAELVEIIVPARPERTEFTAEEVLALRGDAERGRIAAARCVMCHVIDGVGAEFGPDLKGFGSRQPPEVLAQAIVDPSAGIAQGFDGTAIQLRDGRWIDGLILSDGDPVVTRSTGGITQRVPRRQIAHRHAMDRSLMLNADQLGLSAQEVADIIEWMKGY